MTLLKPPLAAPLDGSLRLTPNRRQLNNRNGSLAFNIVTNKQFVEVILTNDRSLFSDGARRTPGNFFASRSVGLLRVTSPDEIYVVPPAALRNLAEAGRRSGAIYYTAIGYDDESGRNPVLVMPPAALVADAPFVEVAPDFTAQSLSRLLGTSLDRLVAVGEERESQRDDHNTYAQAAPAPRTTWSWEGAGSIQIPSAQELEVEPLDVDADGWDRSFEHDEDAAEPYRAEAPAADSQRYANGRRHAAAADDYDDGYGADDGSHGQSRALDSVYPHGSPEPAELMEGRTYADEADEADEARGPSAPPTRPTLLPPPQRLVRIFEEVARTLDGRSLYAVARETPDGLSFGVGSFTQKSGALGELVQRMRAKDPAAFTGLFEDIGNELVTTLTAADPAARMRPVAGRLLSDPGWLARFERAGSHPPFMAVQSELLAERVVAPLWPVVDGLGITSDRGIACAVVFGMALGVDGAARWLTRHLSPVQAPAQLQQALASLNVPDLRAFQRHERILETGDVDPLTHARLTAALRALGPRSRVPVSSPQQMLEAIVRHAAAEPFGRKLAALSTSALSTSALSTSALSPSAQPA